MATEQNEQTQDLEQAQTEQQTAQDTEQAEVSVESLQEQLSKLEENLKQDWEWTFRQNKAQENLISAIFYQKYMN